MENVQDIVEILLKAFRYYDDENDLARFDNFMEAAIAAMRASGSTYHMGILRSLFREALEDGKNEG